MNKETLLSLLDLIERPLFCVRDGMIIHVNRTAGERAIFPDTPVSQVLGDNMQAYTEFTGGCLFLTVTAGHLPHGATVTRMEDFDLFLLQNEDLKLQALSLAAQSLRAPLNDVMTVADAMTVESSKVKHQAGGLHKGLNQLHRIICNMSDTGWYMLGNAAKMETTELNSYFQELMDKLQPLVKDAGYKLHYVGPMQNVLALADRDMLERAVSNLFSNAIKFSPAGSLLSATVTVSGDMLKFSLLDQGPRDPEADPAHLFTRYLRAPAVEDGRYGIGLGLPLVASVAAAHGGTALVDHPGTCGTRVTFTLKLRTEDTSELHCPVKHPSWDYAGGRDRGLLELSEVLPAKSYRPLTEKE